MSIEKPYPSEQLGDCAFEEMIGNLCSRPGMMVSPATFAAVCAYISGFDAGRGGGPLLGFREWLVLRLNDGNNLTWVGLVDAAIPPDADERRRISALGELAGKYFRYRHDEGITKVFYDYGRWLLRRRWYRGPLRGTTRRRGS